MDKLLGVHFTLTWNKLNYGHNNYPFFTDFDYLPPEMKPKPVPGEAPNPFEEEFPYQEVTSEEKLKEFDEEVKRLRTQAIINALEDTSSDDDEDT